MDPNDHPPILSDEVIRGDSFWTIGRRKITIDEKSLNLHFLFVKCLFSWGSNNHNSMLHRDRVSPHCALPDLVLESFAFFVELPLDTFPYCGVFMFCHASMEQRLLASTLRCVFYQLGRRKLSSTAPYPMAKMKESMMKWPLELLQEGVRSSTMVAVLVGHRAKMLMSVLRALGNCLCAWLKCSCHPWTHS